MVKISILPLKNLQIIQVFPVLSSVKSNSACFGMKLDPWKYSPVQGSSKGLLALKQNEYRGSLVYKQTLSRNAFGDGTQNFAKYSTE